MLIKTTKLKPTMMNNNHMELCKKLCIFSNMNVSSMCTYASHQ